MEKVAFVLVFYDCDDLDEGLKKRKRDNWQQAVEGRIGTDHCEDEMRCGKSSAAAMAGTQPEIRHMSHDYYY